MSETRLSEVDMAKAQAVMRHVGPTEALEAGILTPMAGTRPVRLFSLDEVERFLTVHDGSAVALGGAWATVNYVEPNKLATWVDEILDDKELSAALDDIAKTRKPYGFLVPELKTLIASRVDQLNDIIGVTEVVAE